MSYLANAVELLRGPVGTQVTIGVQKAGSDDLRELTLTRNTIRVPTVVGDHRKPDKTWDFMLDDEKKIGYIRLTQIGMPLEVAANISAEPNARGNVESTNYLALGEHRWWRRGRGR